MAWTLGSFFMSKKDTELFCASLATGAPRAEVLALAAKEGFITPRKGSQVLHKRAAYGRFVCLVEFNDEDLLTQKRFSALD